MGDDSGSEEGKMTDKQRENVLDWADRFQATLKADYWERNKLLSDACFYAIVSWLDDLRRAIDEEEEPEGAMNIVQVQFYGKLNQGKRYTFRIPKGVVVKKGDVIRFKVMDGEYMPNNTHKLNGKEYEITYVLSGWGLEDGFVVLGIKPCKVDEWY